MSTINDYLEEIFEKRRGGDAGERTYYPVLENLLKEAGAAMVKIEARKSAVGIPDFKIENEKGELIGYVEAKDPGRDLDGLTKHEDEQLKGYKEEYPNLIVTNFVEFRFFENKQEVGRTIIAQPEAWKLGMAVVKNEGALEVGFQKFLHTTVPQSRTSGQLAKLLADKARTLKKLVAEEINLEDEEKTSTEELLEAFHKTLNPTMTPEEFADMYTQAIVFGLFTARLHFDGSGFDMEKAYRLIPHSIPLLRKVFYVINGADAPQYIRWLIDDMAEVLDKTEMEKIKAEFEGAGKGKDPLFHFYEPFLAEYDPGRREQLGVYYTPLPVVQFITRSVQELLTKEFGKAEGFADAGVTVLDPAAGTMTFTAQAVALAHEAYVKKHGGGGWGDRVKSHILKDFYAFELLMGPYTVGHLKMALMLSSLGYEMQGEDRFPLYLTNTLDMEKYELQMSAVAEELTEESNLAYEVKGKKQVLVVMGNPPYSGHSANKFEWIDKLMDDYKKVGDKPLGEKNPKWLNDDYVKFFRFAEWKIENSGGGIVAFITNHAWLDNPTFRGMRYHFLKAFDEMYIVNLHGSALKKETTPEGGRDEGVFGIKPGTAIMIGVRKAEHDKGMAVVKYAERWGLRKEKFAWLESYDTSNTEWQKLKPADPAYFLVNKDNTGWKEYEKLVPVNEIFPINSVGVVTSRDEFVIDFDREKLYQRISMFRNSTDADEMIKQEFGLNENKSWTVGVARRELKGDQEWEKHFVKMLYRPFDERWIYYHKAMIERSRLEVMKNMSRENLGILYTRPQAPTYEFSCLVSENIIDQCVVGNKSAGGGISYEAPLFVYSVEGQGSLLGEKRPNIDFAKLPKEYADKTPEEIFYYIYAVLYSPIYRKKYAEFLKTDFPRVPMTEDLSAFSKLSHLGERLVKLHLLKVEKIPIEGHKYEGSGENKVEEVKYDERRIYINPEQYFENVSEEVWNYQIGGYQVLNKWLKDRKGRKLKEEERTTYRKIICVLEETRLIQEKIDELTEKWI